MKRKFGLICREYASKFDINHANMKFNEHQNKLITRKSHDDTCKMDIKIIG